VDVKRIAIFATLLLGACAPGMEWDAVQPVAAVERPSVAASYSGVEFRPATIIPPAPVTSNPWAIPSVGIPPLGQWSALTPQPTLTCMDLGSGITRCR
jgi:hypothetical protein